MVELTGKQLDRMERFLTRMGDVLGRKLTVSIRTISPGYDKSGSRFDRVPARTDGRKVDISPLAVDWSNPVRAWLQTKGFFYHEVMHGVSDPMGGRKDPRLRGLHEVLNVLGDQAGEVRFVQLYPGARGYFALNVYEMILKDIGKGKDSEVPLDSRSYAVLYGRRSFLPKRLLAMARTYMRTQFAEEQVREVERLIDAYQAAASLKADEREVQCEAIARKFRDVLGLGMRNPFGEIVDNAHMSKEARDLEVPPAPSVPSLDELEDKPEPEGREGDGESEGEETGPGEEGDGADGDEESDEEGSESEDSGPDGGESSASEPGESEVEGSGDEADDRMAEDDHAEKTQAAAAGAPGEAEGSTYGVPEDLVAELKAAAEKAWKHECELERRETESEVVELGLVESEVEDARTNADKLAALLRKIQAKAASGYESEHRAGRLNLRAVRMSRGRGTAIFQQYIPDRRHATKLNVAIVMDRSGSMGSSLEKVNKMAAAICMACEKAGPIMNKVMLRYFNYEDRLAKLPSEAFKPEQLCNLATGGNHPGTSMFASLDWLRKETGVKVLIILTDSGWDTQDSPCCGRDSHPQDKDFQDSKLVKERAAREGVRVRVLLTTAGGGEDIPYLRERQALPLSTVTYENLPEVVFGIANEAMRDQARKVLA